MVDFRNKFRKFRISFVRSIRLVWEVNPKLVIAIVFLNIISGVFFAPISYIDKQILDNILKNIGKSYAYGAIEIIILLVVLKVFLQFIQSILERVSSYLNTYLSRVFTNHIDLLMARKNSTLDVQTIEDKEFMDRFNKIQRESSNRVLGLMMTLPQLPQSLASIITALIILINFRPILIVIIAILVIPRLLVDLRNTKGRYYWSSEIAPKYRTLGRYFDPLRNKNIYSEVKILNIAPYLIKKIIGVQDDIVSSISALEKKRQKQGFLASIPLTIFYLFFEIYLISLVIIEKITVGSLSFFTSAAYNFRGGLTSLMSNLVDFYENYKYVEDLIWYLDIKSSVVSGSLDFPDQISKIEFKDIWFRYKEDQNWILKGVSLKVNQKENLALVGENGAGKTTLIKLLCRFYDPQKGEILVNGINLKEYKLESLWNNMAVLFQDFAHFSFSARESIGFGRIENLEDMDLISDSAKRTGMHDYIDSLPLKYETPLAPDLDKGVELSGGQWQKVGISRALLRNSQLIIMDEPTSNVDPKSEEEIFDELLDIVKEKNLFIISHRFSTVRRADKIAVMDKGKIVEFGSHEQLMKKKGRYEELFNIQAKAYQ